ncbi:2-ketoarginine methyltransferase [Bradyrhizobium sp. ARR65]|uniref:2-ketoarginine methyltransferase n=1 Tax=Bradyrhizobium sp. ARR65 TaxID=1040989 RepID=UPI0005595083|nr:2-ketoarginine methyltransferase [Bradyrhizobium sp. ARR65]
MEKNFEAVLIEKLEPIRGFFLAQAIFHFFSSGLFDSLAEKPKSVGTLAAEHRLNSDRLTAFMQYLGNENIVVFDGSIVQLTSSAREFGQYRPWYELLVGGYAETLLQISDTLCGAGFASRCDRLVGQGSCGISEYDAIPLVQNLLTRLPSAALEIIDLGCGDGRFAARILDGLPDSNGIGVDVSPPETSPHERLKIEQASALDYVQRLAPRLQSEPPSVVVVAFVLQELLGQAGRPTVVEFLRTLRVKGRFVAVVEVDYRPTDPRVMRHGLGRAYYNPYYLLHNLTAQRLAPIDFWEALFLEAGFRPIASGEVSFEIDSTGLEFGRLLSPY